MDECRAAFEEWLVGKFLGGMERQFALDAWQAAWNRRAESGTFDKPFVFQTRHRREPGGEIVSTSAPIACSMCYGSGYNMAGQPCSCGSLRTRILSKRREIVQLRAENAELSRLITEVAIPALDYSTRNRIGVLSLEPVQYALATLQEAVK